ncbi:unnamed protein product [Paramecium octaurelia]|uniref:Uncharacterized protein n=1 Tax=Paramecium octaurelia TaxID=43137 RepID=A0A8S1SQC3_PAROT|nr:unnamed protein product [Paramecium octaurelia]
MIGNLFIQTQLADSYQVTNSKRQHSRHFYKMKELQSFLNQKKKYFLRWYY